MSLLFRYLSKPDGWLAGMFANTNPNTAAILSSKNVKLQQLLITNSQHFTDEAKSVEE